MTINLNNQDKGHIKYDILTFPDGQRDIVIKGTQQLVINTNNGEVDTKIDLININKSDVTIYSRFNNFEDLGLIICTTKALRNLGVKVIKLYIPYILGARSDRQFVEGGNSYLRDVIAPILNAQNYEQVYCYDVHSHVSSAVINNLVVYSNQELVEWALNDIFSTTKHSLDNTTFIAPDAGAQHKIFQLAKDIKFPGDIITCSKERDLSTGKILQTKIEEIGIVYHNNEFTDFIIIDDICDGGKTFIEIAKVLNKRYPKNKIYLIITHGIFSAAYEQLDIYFDKIYCTNSYKDVVNYGIPGKLIKQLEII